MQNETDANPAAGFKWTDEGGMPRATNGAWNPLTNEIKPDAPVHTLPARVNPSEQAAADWRKYRMDGADLVTLRSNFSKTANALELFTYDQSIAQLRYPAPSRRETSRNWRRGTVARKAAA